MESTHAHDDFFGRIDLVDQARILVHKDDTSCSRGVTIRIQDQFRHRSVEQNIQVSSVLGLSVEAVEARAPAQPVVQRAQALLDSRSVSGVELVHDRNVYCLQCAHEADIRVGHVALVAELKGPVTISRGVIGLEGLVEPVGLSIFGILGLVEVSALDMYVSNWVSEKPKGTSDVNVIQCKEEKA